MSSQAIIPQPSYIMQLRLISHPPIPVMLFTVSFVPTDLHPLPLNWDSQLVVLSAADLEQPRSIYALDSSAWLTEILEQVTFDVVSLTVSVVFTDGHVEDWPLMDRACIDILEGVLNDLRQTVDRPAPSLPPTPPSSPISPSLIPNNPPPPQLPFMAPSSPPPPPSPSRVSVEDVMYKFLTVSKGLRQRARSTLLDAYRRFVVQELKSRLPYGGYTVWIAQSTLRRTEEHMARLADCAPSPISLTLPDFSFDCQTATVPEDLFAYDDDADATSETASLSRTFGTESDGSSVHTPDSTCAFRRGTPAALALVDPNAEAFAALSRRALRLREHLLRVDAAQRNAAADDATLFAIAEVRGRRRAWLNRQLRNGAHLSDLGFATPVHSSQLVRHAPLNAEHLSTSMLRQHIASPRLFPVVEDSEEDSEMWAPLDKAAMVIPPRRHPQVRVRTRSVRYPHGPPEFEAGSVELESPVLVVPPPVATPIPYSAPTVVAPLPEHELDLELGAVSGVFANEKGSEYECGEWLPGILLES
ncbi:hypothetical protein B0F90DRAFT_1821972 [Multifurca ochricompacta]|uniref:Uncharacterized protein n=1 Tax=Multifurca ochricompacta TaxID=376703 RepID=A0AAD4LWT9_9AGAM|nr:hypothetical protein B0F90DRAFT_1821972 [Multifurca ochricompacta]